MQCNSPLAYLELHQPIHITNTMIMYQLFLFILRGHNQIQKLVLIRFFAKTLNSWMTDSGVQWSLKYNTYHLNTKYRKMETFRSNRSS